MVLGRDVQRPGNILHMVASSGQVDVVPNVRQWDTNVFLAGGGAADAENMLRKLAASNRVQVLDLGGGLLTATLQDGTYLTSQPDGTWGKLTFQRPGEAQNLIRFSGPPIRELDLSNRNNDNNNIDRIDSLTTIVEEKDGRGLMDPANRNPDGTLKFTEVQYSAREIFNKMDKRLALLNGLAPDGRPAYLAATRTFKSTTVDRPYSGPDQLPTADELRKIKNVKFELKGDTPALRAAVNADIARLQAKYAGYTFSVTFGAN